MIFYEAPHRLRTTLDDLLSAFGDRPAALCRELTKLHEETLRLTLAQAADHYRDREPRGSTLSFWPAGSRRRGCLWRRAPPGSWPSGRRA